MSASKCPSCGAPVEVKNRFSRVLVCAYCGSHLRVTGDGFDPSSAHPKLAEFPSIFSVGSTGTILGKPFTAMGRMRYSYPGGHFDEWFLDYDGSPAWLAEDEGTYSLYLESVEDVGIPDIRGLRAGENVEVGGMRVMVKEKGVAEVAGAEGELLFYAKPGTKVAYMDGIADGKKVSIEATDDEIEMFIGRPIMKRDIVVQ